MTNRRAAGWFAVFAVVVFAAGLASGVLLDRVLGAPPPVAAFGGWRGGPNPARLAGRLTRELALTPEQSAKVQAIFESRRDKVRQMHRDLRADARRRFQAEQGALRGEIRAVLTVEQQAKFDALLQGGPERMWPGPGRFLGSTGAARTLGTRRPRDCARRVGCAHQRDQARSSATDQCHARVFPRTPSRSTVAWLGGSATSTPGREGSETMPSASRSATLSENSVVSTRSSPMAVITRSRG